MLQVLRRLVFLDADSPVRPVEDVEHLGDAVDRRVAVQRNALLQSEIGAVLRRRDHRITRDDRAVRAQARAEGGAGLAQIATVAVRLTNAGAEVMKSAHLEAVRDLPD